MKNKGEFMVISYGITRVYIHKPVEYVTTSEVPPRLVHKCLHCKSEHSTTLCFHESYLVEKVLTIIDGKMIPGRLVLGEIG